MAKIILNVYIITVNYLNIYNDSYGNILKLFFLELYKKSKRKIL